LVFELSNALCQSLHLGVPHRFAGIVVRCGLWRTRRNDVGYADTRGRSEIADVNPARRIDPCVEVSVGRLQRKRAGNNCRQSCLEETSKHYRHLTCLFVFDDPFHCFHGDAPAFAAFSLFHIRGAWLNACCCGRDCSSLGLDGRQPKRAQVSVTAVA
jgi:hypothetical protein